LGVVPAKATWGVDGDCWVVPSTMGSQEEHQCIYPFIIINRCDEMSKDWVNDTWPWKRG